MRTMSTFVGARGNELIFRHGGATITQAPARAVFQVGVDEITMWGPVTLPYEGALAFPLSVGKKWEYRWAGTMPDLYRRGAIVNLVLNAKVAGWDAVRTVEGTGTFHAFRVEIEQQPPKPYDADSKIYYWTLWYAPAAKCVVKWTMQARDAMYAEGAELLEFRSGP